MRKLKLAIRLLLLCLYINIVDSQLISPVKQWPSCNNCYAVVARDVLLYHMPRLKNVTLQQLMEDSHQTCAGGVPTKIWNHYFHKRAKITSITKMGSFQKKLAEIILKHGPVVINKGKSHLVTAFNVDNKGILIRDPKNLSLQIWKTNDIMKEQTKGFFYIAYPIF